MFRHISKVNLLVLILVSLTLGGIVRFAFHSSAASTPPTVKQLTYTGYTNNNDSVTADASDNLKNVTFRTEAVDAALPKKLRTQVHYKATSGSDTSWHTLPASKYVLSGGWACGMGWTGWPVIPKDCNSSGKSTNGTSGIPAWSGYPIYASVRIGPGASKQNMTYQWQVRAEDSNGTISAWSATWTFHINNNTAYPPTAPVAKCTDQNANNYGGDAPCTFDQPDPPAPSADSGDSGGSDVSGDTGAETVVADNSAASNADNSAPVDTQAPTVPQNVQGSFDKDSNSISISWDESSDDNSVAGYQVQRAEKGTANWSTVGDVASGQFTDFQFAPNKTYEYQVRAYDESKNYSAWSSSAEVVAGDFKPNVTVADGGSVSDSKGIVNVNIPPGAVDNDLVILINPVKVKGMTLPANSKLVGSYYDIKAKDSQGNEVTKFKRQISISFNYSKMSTFGVVKSTLAIAYSPDNKKVTVLRTGNDGKSVTTLTDHFTLYFVTAQKTGIGAILAWIVLWLLIIGGVIAGGYYGWQRYQLYRYQQDHREDFIYKH